MSGFRIFGQFREGSVHQYRGGAPYGEYKQYEDMGYITIYDDRGYALYKEKWVKDIVEALALFTEHFNITGVTRL